MARSSNPSARILSAPAHPARGFDPLAAEPHRYKQRHKRRLRPITQKQPGNGGTRRPEHHAPGPVLLQVKYLPRQKDARTQADGTHRMQGEGKGRKTFRRHRPRGMEKPHEQQGQPEALWRGQHVPVRRDEQQHARSQKQASETDCQQHRPTKSVRLFPLILVGADPLRFSGPKQAGAGPSIETTFPMCAQQTLPARVADDNCFTCDAHRRKFRRRMSDDAKKLELMDTGHL